MTVKKIVLLTLTPLIFLSNSCTGDRTENTGDRPVINPDFLSTVKTVKAAAGRQKETLTLNGKVEYDPDKVVHYFPLIGGIVEKVYFSMGDKVGKGETLLDVRSADLSALQSELVSLQAEINVVEREVKTAREMFNDNMLSERELMEAESKLKQTQATLARVQNDMRLFGSDKGSGVFSLKAPASGYIVSKRVSSGSTISSGDEALFTIADLSEVWVMANVYAGNLQFVKEGMEVNFTTLSYPGEVFDGKIDRLSQVFDPDDKVLKARITMPNQDLKLKPEMPVVVHLRNETDERVVAIPSDALIFDDNRYFVVTKNDGDNFQINEIQLQGHNENTSYVRSGISEGDEVVISGQLLIYSGLNEK
ncbi:efflux RND transporter periplasmic adaptor subunit [Proteiniphilum sp.]|uniref:efflux RND transporter periplasmic adaptor subunit n=1 Tax=Proteiniphilum sp. TaxID=1926877 RepID=UPI003316F139